MAREADLPAVGPWAREKLELLRKYLAAYTTILRKQEKFKGYVYVDAFAGAGQAEVRSTPAADDSMGATLLDVGDFVRRDEDARQVIAGSPRVALDIEPPFTHYVFVERDPSRIAQLNSLRAEYGNRRNIVIRPGDCSAYLWDKLIKNPKVDWKKWRAVVFLDPFGMHVSWKTLAGLAATRAVEVFVNFPVGMAIQRLLKRNGEFTAKERAKLDEYFGDPSWHEAVYRQVSTLFGDEVEKLDDSSARLVDWYRSRLAAAFGFVAGARLVRNSHGGHLYYLIWAGPKKVGAKIADHVLRWGAST